MEKAGAQAHKQDLDGLAEKLAQAITGDHLANIWEGCQLPGGVG